MTSNPSHQQPQIPYGHQWISDEEIQEVLEILRSDWITQGPRASAFENDLAQYSGSAHVGVLSSGTAALQAAMHATGIGPGDDVIIPAITFVATGNSVFHKGAKPVIADVNPITGLIDIDDLRTRITNRTKAIIPVHLAGVSCDMELIREIADRKNLKVVEDACHALGGEYQGKKTCGCAYSDMAVTSFHPVKSITTGEGGAVFSNDSHLVDRARAYRSHGVTKDPERLTENHGPWYYEMHELGTNARLTDFQCALGQVQLRRLDSFIARRRDIAQYYTNRFQDLTGLHYPPAEKGSAWHLYVVQVEPAILGANRLEVFRRLRDKGLGVNVHYIPLHYQPYYRKHLGVSSGDFPGAETYYQNSISLPIYPLMSDQEVDHVVDAVRSTVLDLHKVRLWSMVDSHLWNPGPSIESPLPYYP
jgi:perosamine synthetase